MRLAAELPSVPMVIRVVLLRAESMRGVVSKLPTSSAVVPTLPPSVVAFAASAAVTKR